MLEMNIDSIRVSIVNYQRVVILRVKETNRYLPIWIGPAEADSIAYKMQKVEVPRPLTHDLLLSVISTLGATVDRIVVSELTDDTFFAKIVLSINGATYEVDSRPSDAIALAVRTEAPIFADDTVVEKAGIQMDEKTGKPIIHGDTGQADQTKDVSVGEEELKSLSAFTGFIETLNLDDLGTTEEGKLPPTGSETE